MNRALLGIMSVDVLLCISRSFHTPFLSSFYSTQGLRESEIGILVAIAPIASLCIQPLWAALSDRTGKRRSVLVFVILASGLAAMSYLLGHSFPTFFVAALMFATVNSPIIPLADAIISREAKRKNFDFARIRFLGTVLYALIALAAGGFIKDNPKLIFFLCLGAYTCAGIAARLFLPKDDAPVVREKRDCSAARVKGEKIFHSDDAVFLFIFAFLVAFGLTFSTSFTNVFAISVGYTQQTSGLLACVSSLSELPVLIIVVRLIKKYGAIPLVAFSGLMVSVRLLLASGGSLPFFLAAQMMQSVTYLTSNYACVLYVTENVAPEKISRGQSLLVMVKTGGGSVLGSILGGYISDYFGLQASFRFMSVLVFSLTVLAIAAYVIFRRRRSRLAAVSTQSDREIS